MGKEVVGIDEMTEPCRMWYIHLDENDCVRIIALLRALSLDTSKELRDIAHTCIAELSVAIEAKDEFIRSEEK